MNSERRARNASARRKEISAQSAWQVLAGTWAPDRSRPRLFPASFPDVSLAMKVTRVAHSPLFATKVRKTKRLRRRQFRFQKISDKWLKLENALCCRFEPWVSIPFFRFWKIVLGESATTKRNASGEKRLGSFKHNLLHFGEAHRVEIHTCVRNPFGGRTSTITYPGSQNM